MKKFLFITICFALIPAFYSCHDEEKSMRPYMGTWETEVYTVPVDTLGSLVNQKMVFVIEEESFSDTIFHVIGHLEQPLFAVNGIIDRAGDATLHFTLTQLGEVLGTRIDWESAGSPGFDSLYTEWLEPYMPSEFDAEYVIAGNELDLILDDTGDTIQLFRL